MIDPCQIGPSVQTVLQTYFQLARGTGRTSVLLSALQEGDLIVCLLNSGRDLRTRIRDEGFTNVKLFTCTADANLSDLHLRMPRSSGRILFDHSWLELYFYNLIKGSTDDLVNLSRRLSNQGLSELSSTMDSGMGQINLDPAQLNIPTYLPIP